MTIKKFFFGILFLSFANVNLQASTGSAGQAVKWELNDDGILTFSGSGKMKDFGERPYRPQLVKTVVISEGITSIGKNAFKGCANLTNVTIPSSCKEIGDKAFNNCKSLPGISIPYGVTSIGNEAFAGCVLFTDMDLPGSVRAIGANAFEGCRSLVRIRIPATVVTLGQNAFKGCQYIATISELPSFVNSAIASQFSLNNSLVSKYWLSQESAKDYVAVEPITIPAKQVKKGKSDVETVPVSDVDVSIPRTNLNNDKTFAVIISNENYSKMPDVPFALNDGQSFRKYCENTLGIPANNILHYSNATSGVMREVLSELRMANRFVGNEMKVIFYYSGHGAPDNATQEGYLIPVDASRVTASVCLPLSELYESLGKLDVAMTTVFLDACFSGGERTGGTLLADDGTRLVVIKQKEMSPTKKMVVFGATDGAQTALPYTKQGHGFFTYFLLKKLKDSGGSASLAEIQDYLKEEVYRTAYRESHMEQTPTVSVSPDVSNVWRTYKLNN